MGRRPPVRAVGECLCEGRSTVSWHETVLDVSSILGLNFLFGSVLLFLSAHSDDQTCVQSFFREEILFRISICHRIRVLRRWTKRWPVFRVCHKLFVFVLCYNNFKFWLPIFNTSLGGYSSCLLIFVRSWCKLVFSGFYFGLYESAAVGNESLNCYLIFRLSSIRCWWRAIFDEKLGNFKVHGDKNDFDNHINEDSFDSVSCQSWLLRGHLRVIRVSDKNHKYEQISCNVSNFN